MESKRENHFGILLNFYSKDIKVSERRTIEYQCLEQNDNLTKL